MSLRIIIQPDQVAAWINARQGTPVRQRGTDTNLRIAFGEPPADCEPISMEELLETMKFGHRALLIDEEPGRTFHQFVERG